MFIHQEYYTPQLYIRAAGNNMPEYQIIAEDISPEWKKQIEDAKDSVVIFTPYFSDYLNSLLKLTNDKVKKTVVTHNNIFDLVRAPHQLRSMLQLMEECVELYCVDKLHAKVLIIDGKIKTAGSQNFSHNGTKNIEVTVSFNDSSSSAKVLSTLLSNLTIKNMVTPEWVKKLLDISEQISPKLDKFHNRIIKEIEELKDTQAVLETKAPYRARFNASFSKIEVTLRAGTDVKDPKKVVFRDTKDQSKYQVDEKPELNRFIAGNADGVVFTKRDYYPMLIKSSERVIFVKSNSSVISGYIDGYELNGFQLGDNINNTLVTIVFPATNTNRRNIILKIKRGREVAKAKFKLSGNNVFFIRNSESFSKSSTPTFEDTVRTVLLNSQKNRNAFFEEIFYDLNWTGSITPERLNNVFNQQDKKHYVLGLEMLASNPYYTLD